MHQESPPVQDSNLLQRNKEQSVYKFIFKNYKRGIPGGSVVNNLPCSAGDTDSIPDPARSHMPQSN